MKKAVKEVLAVFIVIAVLLQMPMRTNPFFSKVKADDTDSFSIIRPNEETLTTVNAADFGLSESNSDNTQAFNNALLYCKNNRYTKLIINTGTYYFRSDTALLINECKDLLIEGNNSKFIFTTTACYYKTQILNCNCVEIRNLNFDWDWENDRLASVVKVVGVGNKTIDLEFIELSNVDVNIKFAAITQCDPLTFTMGAANSSKEAFFGDGEITGRSKINNNTLRILHKGAMNSFAIGEYYILRHYTYGSSTFDLGDESINITFDNVNIYGSSGMAYRCSGGCSYFQILNGYIGVDPKHQDTRHLSLCADAIHIVDTKGHFKVENCDISGMGDDGLNVHDSLLYVTAVNGNQFEARKNCENINVGDRLAFKDANYENIDYTAVIEEMSWVRDDIYSFRVDSGLNPNVKPGTIAYSADCDSGNYVIRNNYFHENRARGALLQSSNGICENNRFYKIMGQAIKVVMDISVGHWYEGTGVDNLVIKNNEFDNCNYSSWGSDIEFGTNMDGRELASKIFSNVEISGNTFKGDNNKLMKITNTNGINIHDNYAETVQENCKITFSSAVTRASATNNIRTSNGVPIGNISIENEKGVTYDPNGGAFNGTISTTLDGVLNSYRYVRVYGGASNSDGGFLLREIEVYDDTDYDYVNSSTNISLKNQSDNSTATPPNGSPDNLKDGNINGAHCGFGYTQCYLQIDFSSPIGIKYLKLFYLNDRQYHDIMIVLSNSATPSSDDRIIFNNTGAPYNGVSGCDLPYHSFVDVSGTSHSYPTGWDRNLNTYSSEGSVIFDYYTVGMEKSVPTKDNCVFLGWATSKDKADLGIMEYAHSARCYFGNKIDLFAVWNGVSYDPNGGMFNGSSDTVFDFNARATEYVRIYLGSNLYSYKEAVLSEIQVLDAFGNNIIQNANICVKIQSTNALHNSPNGDPNSLKNNGELGIAGNEHYIQIEFNSPQSIAKVIIDVHNIDRQHSDLIVALSNSATPKSDDRIVYNCSSNGWFSYKNESGAIINYPAGNDHDISQSSTITVNSRYVVGMGMPTPVKDGCLFEGWNAKPDGTGTAYEHGETINSVGEVTFYAQWHSHNFIDGACECGEVICTAVNGATLENDLLHGLTANMTEENFADYLDLADGYTLEIVSSDMGYGTGTKLNIKNIESKTVCTFETVVFGDVNGDGWRDGMDAVIAKCFLENMLTENDFTATQFEALDANRDEEKSYIDVEMMENMGLLLN